MSNTPNIRFAGFTDAWKQRKLSEVVGIYDGTHQTPNYQDHGVMFVSVEDIQTLISDKYISEEDFAKNYSVVPEQGDILMTRIGDIGTANIVKSAEPLAFYVSLALLKNKGTNAEFLRANISAPEFQNELWLRTLHTAYPKKINKEEIGKCMISIAPDLKEQEHIGSLFNELDNLITLHQRKCDETKKLKKYMLKKMFPQNGALIPEIRFAGFTDAWKQRKFSDFTRNAGKRNKDDLDLEPYAITNEHGFIRQTEAHDDFGYMKDTDRKAYNIVMPNSFAYNPARINVGSIGYYEGTENVIVSSLYEVFQTADYVDDRFLWHWFKSDEFPKWIGRLQEGSVRLYFYYDKLCECQMLMPSVLEQKRIAEILDGIDDLITLHQRKCDELKDVKKYMLQNMFPQKG